MIIKAITVKSASNDIYSFLKEVKTSIGHLTNFYRDSYQKELKNNDEKSKAASLCDEPIAWKSSSKLLVTS